MKNNLLIAVVALSALAAGYWFSTLQNAAESAASASRQTAKIQGAVIQPARQVGIPELVQDNGKTLTKEDLKGHWSLIFFGYTHCPDVCPVTMNILAQTKKLAEETEPGFAFPQVYFVSVDPKRDSAEQLAGYVKYFDKAFIGVTGEESLIKAFTLQLSAVYMIMDPEDASKPEEYNVDHSSALYLLNPDGRMAALLNEPFTSEQLIHDIKSVQALTVAH